jgi:integrase
VLDPLSGHQLRTTTVAVRSLFRFARKRGLVFANPAARLKAADPGGSLLPMTDAEIRAVEQAATSPAQRLIVALAAVHAARWAAIRDLTLDDLDLPNRRITIAGHPSGSASSPTGRCGPGWTIAAPPGRAPPTGTS